MSGTAVVTIVAGRHEHLARQRAALSGDVTHVVVAMRAAEADALGALGGDVVALAGHVDPLPLARARNAGAARALALGARLLVFLDVDCIPGPRLLERYAAAATVRPNELLCGPVAYLPEGAGPARPHPARPIPAGDALESGGDHRLFWSLSFALTRATWERIGGFCEDYVGYGGEDTDFGQSARAHGVDLTWVGGAWAYHQHHDSAPPPARHRDAILANAARFHARWGWWPMEGWLAEIGAQGAAVTSRPRSSAATAAGCWAGSSPSSGR
jgi:hypothetical protein